MDTLSNSSHTAPDDSDADKDYDIKKDKGKGGTDTSSLSASGNSATDSGGESDDDSILAGADVHLPPVVKAKYAKNPPTKKNVTVESEEEDGRNHNWLPCEKETLMEAAMPMRRILRDKTIKLDDPRKNEGLNLCFRKNKLNFQNNKFI